jgi:hypothetical protein
VRQGGATARRMLIQAAANAWNVPASECRAAKSMITHAPSGRTVTYGKVADAAAKIDSAEGRGPEGPEGLEDCRPAAEAAGHGREAHRQADLWRRSQAARDGECGDQGLPGLRRQGAEL